MALLRRISDEGLLTAIADGTFGITRRPADGGRGLDGVIERADGYFNPARPRARPGSGHHERMSSGCVRPYGDTTGDGRVQVSFTLPVPSAPAERALAEGAALQLAAKMGLDPAMVVHAKGMGPDFTFFIVYGRVSHLVDLDRVTVAEREFPLLSPAEVNLRIRVGAGPQAGRGRRLHRHRRAHGGHRRDPQRQGARGGEGPGVLPGDPGGEPGRPGRGARPGGQGRAPSGADAVLVSQVVTQRDAHLANARELAAAFRGAADPGRPAAAGRRRPAVRPGAGAGLGVDKIFGRGTTPGEVASYLAHALAPGSRDGEQVTA